MAITYAVATGHDVPAIDLDPIVPQPQSTGVQFARRSVAASGDIVEEGPYIELVWTLLGDAGDYNDLLEQFGLDAATTAAVTVFVRNEFWAGTRYNGLAVRPEMGQSVRWSNYFPRQITVLIRDLVEAAE